MKLTDYIEDTINRIQKGYVFTYVDINTEVNSREAVIKALNRMSASGKIEKLSKGKFYKPEITAFGKLQPDQYQIVKDLLVKDGKTIGYLTGYSIYNKLGLTTQVSNIIQIGKQEIRPKFKRGRYTIGFIKQKNTISKKNIPLLQILDVLRYIKIIPDTTVATACERLLLVIKDLEEKDKSGLVRLAKKYPPSTRALLGALLEEMGNGSLTELLRKSLNPITVYKLTGVNEVLSCGSNWSIWS